MREMIGFMVGREAQIMPTLTSMLDQREASALSPVSCKYGE